MPAATRNASRPVLSRLRTGMSPTCLFNVLACSEPPNHPAVAGSPQPSPTRHYPPSASSVTGYGTEAASVATVYQSNSTW